MVAALSVADSEAWTLVAAAVAGLGTLGAAVASALSASAAKQSAEATRQIAQRDQERRDEERARSLTASVIGFYVRSDDASWLRVENLGPHAAFGVSVTADPLPRGLNPADLPDELAPGALIMLPYRIIPSAPDPETCLRWTDGSGAARDFPVHATPTPLEAGRTAAERAAIMRSVALNAASY
jgi:hypothetical protein